MALVAAAAHERPPAHAEQFTRLAGERRDTLVELYQAIAQRADLEVGAIGVEARRRVAQIAQMREAQRRELMLEQDLFRHGGVEQCLARTKRDQAFELALQLAQ